MRKSCVSRFVGVWFMGSIAGVAAQDAAAIKEYLSRPIISPQLAMDEVEAFNEKRVPAMPDVKSVEEWEKEAKRMRAEILEKVIYRGEAAKWRDAECKVEWFDTIDGGPGYKIRKLRYEAVPGMWIPALLYLPDKIEGKVPVIMNVNGHDAKGKAAPYKQIRCINQAKRGMIALNVEWFGMGQLRTPGFEHGKMNQLDLCGTSGIAPFYLSMRRGIDLLLSLDHADPERVAVMGLSGGGWQTIFISSLDERVTLANPVAGYSSFKTRTKFLSDLGDSEQTPNDLALYADYTHLTAMRAPRPTLLTYNIKDDCCFASDHALQPLLDAALPIYRLYGKETNLRSHVNTDPGTHNFERDNREAVYGMIGDFFYPGDRDYDATEIPSDNEVKTAEELMVPMPEKQEDFHTLALAIGKNLPRDGAIPTAPAELEKWKEQKRVELRQFMRWKPFDAKQKQLTEERQANLTVSRYTIRSGEDWTIPLIRLTPPNPSESVLLISDNGRVSLAQEAAQIVSSGCEAAFIDPFYFGESHPAERDYLHALLIAGVGDRPLRLQVSEVLQAASLIWATTGTESKSRLTLKAVGPRSSLISLLVGAIQPSTVGKVEISVSMKSLQDVIEKDMKVEQAPELFCFGLLESFDIDQLKALAGPTVIETD